MDISDLLTRAWNVIWNNKFLIILGTIASILLGRGGGGYNFSIPGDTGGYSGEGEGPYPGDFSLEDFNLEDYGLEIGLIVSIAIALFCVILLFTLIIQYLGYVAEGSLVAGANHIAQHGDGSITFGPSWNQGWERGLPLFGINLLVGIPALLAILLGAALAIPIVLAAGSVEEATAEMMAATGLIALLVGLLCVVLLISIPLWMLRELAIRYCIVEHSNVWESFELAWTMLRNNLGQVALLYVLQIVAGLLLGIALIPISILLCITCIGIPLIWVAQGMVFSYFSSLWTLAWRGWAGKDGTPPALRDVGPEPALA